jgi:N-acetylneuraminic acid mutarotase
VREKQYVNSNKKGVSEMNSRMCGMRKATITIATLACLANVDSASAQSGMWTIKASSPTPRRNPAVASLNGILYMAGGAPPGSTSSIGTFEAYDPALDTWSTKAPLPIDTQGAAAGAINGIFYVVGGGSCCGPYNYLQAYDPTSNSWTIKASMPTARYYPAAAVVNGILYVMGGGYNGDFSALESYNPASNTWTTMAAMPTARSGHNACVVNGIIYVIGGINLSGRLTTVEAYDAASNSWSTKAPMPTARYFASAGVVNGIIYVVGGSSSSGNVPTVEAYDPVSNIWTTQASLPAGLNTGQNSADTVNDLLYVMCGQDNVDSSVRVVAAFTPMPALNILHAVELRWISLSNQVYQVQSSTNLADWVSYGGPISTPAGTTNQVFDSTDVVKKFYRLKVQ